MTAAALVEQRSASRFLREPKSDYASIWYPQELAKTVEVHDESLGGLGVFVDNGSDFAVGMELGVVYAGAMYRCYVRHAQRHSDGRTLIGMECQKTEGS